MSFIEIGIRQNLVYPFLFMITINLMRTIRIIIQEIFENFKINYIFSLLNFISAFICSLIFLYFENKINTVKRNSRIHKIIGIEIIQNQYNEEDVRKRIDDQKKIIFLVFLDSYFDFFGSIRKEYLLKRKPANIKSLIPLDIRIRSREIIFASLISFFFLRTELNKHHKFSLIIISLCILLIYIFEVSYQFNNDYYSDFFDFLRFQFLKVVINICRVFSDVIEKYLFEFNSVHPLKILLIKGLAESLYIGLFYLFKSNNEFSNLFDNKKNESLYIFIFILLLIIYFIISGFSSIYKIFTVKIYSPMTRTLFDSILDFGYFLYYSIEKEEKNYKKINTLYFWTNFIGQFIIIFFNLVYNEFLILKFCDLEKETHLEITKRALIVELFNESMTERSESADEKNILNTTL